MNTWSSYALQDFIPFIADSYFRLLERMGEAFWPLHLLTVVLGLAAIWLVFKKRGRLACLLLAPVWAFVGFAFFIQLYAQINWAGGYIGYVFIAQAGSLILIALTGLGLDNGARKRPSAVIGIGIALVGLLVWPFIAPLTGGSWFQAEVFGIHADPTAIMTLGLALVMLRGWWVWLIALIPAVWLLISGLTLWVLAAPVANMLFALLAIALTGLVWKKFERKIAAADS